MWSKEVAENLKIAVFLIKEKEKKRLLFFVCVFNLKNSNVKQLCWEQMCTETN